jgi:hypothetical protein
MDHRKPGQPRYVWPKPEGCTHRPPPCSECIEPGVFYNEATAEVWVSLYAFLGERGVAFARQLASCGLDNQAILGACAATALERMLTAFPDLAHTKVNPSICGHPKGGES